MILRVDARQFIGGVNGGVGDAGVYLPLPGSSKTFVMFAGPSITLATHHYLQRLYGVTPQQSLRCALDRSTETIASGGIRGTPCQA
jgi:outer membrane scaffolding protein for murein synthesis (MipA/OmpV family)